MTAAFLPHRDIAAALALAAKDAKIAPASVTLNEQSLRNAGIELVRPCLEALFSTDDVRALVARKFRDRPALVEAFASRLSRIEPVSDDEDGEVEPFDVETFEGIGSPSSFNHARMLAARGFHVFPQGVRRVLATRDLTDMWTEHENNPDVPWFLAGGREFGVFIFHYPTPADFAEWLGPWCPSSRSWTIEDSNGSRTVLYRASPVDARLQAGPLFKTRAQIRNSTPLPNGTNLKWAERLAPPQVDPASLSRETQSMLPKVGGPWCIDSAYTTHAAYSDAR